MSSASRVHADGSRKEEWMTDVAAVSGGFSGEATPPADFNRNPRIGGQDWHLKVVFTKTRLAILRLPGNLPVDWFGVVAQLVERLVRNEKVRGSTPLGSTTQRNEWFFEFWRRFDAG